MEIENEPQVSLRESEVPVMMKYRRLDKWDQCRVQGYVDALIDPQVAKKESE